MKINLKAWNDINNLNLDFITNPGLYALYLYRNNTFCTQLLYIGSARNVRKRLWSYAKLYDLIKFFDKQNNMLIKYKYIDDNNSRKSWEKWLISRLNPPLNREYSWLWRRNQYIFSRIFRTGKKKITIIDMLYSPILARLAKKEKMGGEKQSKHVK